MTGSIYGPYARLVRAVARFLLRGWTVTTEETPPAAAVFVARHQNLAGPILSAALLPREVRIWVLHVFFSRRECFAHYYHFTFTCRFHWPRPLAFCTAGLLSLVIPPLIASLNAIPVYRGSTRVAETLKASAKALAAGESVLICPDQDYTSTAGETGALYRGFLHLERQSVRSGGGHVPFVPLCCAASAHRFVVGCALLFPGNAPFKAEQSQVALALAQALDRMGAAYREPE